MNSRINTPKRSLSLAPRAAASAIDDFRAYMPTHSYIFTPCREIWAGSSVNARLPRGAGAHEATAQPKRNKLGKPVTISATQWLDQNRPVEQMTWCPGVPMLIRDRLVVDGGWIERKDVTCFNLYRPPRLELGDAGKAGALARSRAQGLSRRRRATCIHWLAQRVQRAAGQDQPRAWCSAVRKASARTRCSSRSSTPSDRGISTRCLPLKCWAVSTASPSPSSCASARPAISARFDRFKFYDHTKVYTAAPPDVLRVDEKHLREHYVFNCLGFVITTNHKTDGIYLPADDRRHYVAWSNRSKDEFAARYWKRLWDWYENSGFGHVAAYLGELDLSGFDAKAPPPKTPAFWDIVNASQAPEDAELADVLDALDSSNITTLSQLITEASGGVAEWLMDRKNRRTLPHRLERCGYVAVRNPDRDDGLWIVEGARQVIYAKAQLSAADRLRAARELVNSQTTGR